MKMARHVLDCWRNMACYYKLRGHYRRVEQMRHDPCAPFRPVVCRTCLFREISVIRASVHGSKMFSCSLTVVLVRTVRLEYSFRLQGAIVEANLDAYIPTKALQRKDDIHRPEHYEASSQILACESTKTNSLQGTILQALELETELTA